MGYFERKNSAQGNVKDLVFAVFSLLYSLVVWHSLEVHTGLCALAAYVYVKNKNLVFTRTSSALS